MDGWMDGWLAGWLAGSTFQQRQIVVLYACRRTCKAGKIALFSIEPRNDFRSPKLKPKAAKRRKRQRDNIRAERFVDCRDHHLMFSFNEISECLELSFGNSFSHFWSPLSVDCGFICGLPERIDSDKQQNKQRRKKTLGKMLKSRKYPNR